MGKHLAVLLASLLILVAAGVPTATARRRSRLNCAARAGRGAGCNSNVSFFKRLLEEKYREGDTNTDLDETPYEEAEVRREDELDTKILLLRELLKELQRDDEDNYL